MSLFPKNIQLLSLFFLISWTAELNAQTDSLPKFSLVEKNGIVFISWNNPFPEVTQMIIQRSNDSVSFFRSIMSMPDPSAVSNGFVDRKPGAAQMFYRLFYVMPGGRYTFTSTQKPVHTEIEKKSIVVPKDNKVDTTTIIASPIPSYDPIKKVELVQAMGRSEAQKDNRDRTNPIVKLDSIEGVTTFQPSAFIFSNGEGNLVLLLPEAERRLYHLHVYREDGKPVFTMRNIKERHLLVDRSNFYQSGWFRFELFEGNTLKDKNRFFIPAEGR